MYILQTTRTGCTGVPRCVRHRRAYQYILHVRTGMYTGTMYDVHVHTCVCTTSRLALDYGVLVHRSLLEHSALFFFFDLLRLGGNR